MKTNKTLDMLVQTKAIDSYRYVNLNELDEEAETPTKYCNSEKIQIKFRNGQILEMQTWCSGSGENTGFAIKSND